MKCTHYKDTIVVLYEKLPELFTTSVYFHSVSIHCSKTTREASKEIKKDLRQKSTNTKGAHILQYNTRKQVFKKSYKVIL